MLGGCRGGSKLQGAAVIFLFLHLFHLMLAENRLPSLQKGTHSLTFPPHVCNVEDLQNQFCDTNMADARQQLQTQQRVPMRSAGRVAGPSLMAVL